MSIKFETIIDILLTFAYFILGLYIGASGGYMNGQIDAINGIIKYELQVNPDKTAEYVAKGTK